VEADMVRVQEKEVEKDQASIPIAGLQEAEDLEQPVLVEHPQEKKKEQEEQLMEMINFYHLPEVLAEVEVLETITMELVQGTEWEAVEVEGEAP